MTTPYYCLRQILLLPSFFFPERCLINILWISGEDKDALFQQLFFLGISRWAITSSLRFCSWALTLGKSCLPSLWLADDSNCPDDLNQKAINQKVERGARRLLLSRWDGGADTFLKPRRCRPWRLSRSRKTRLKPAASAWGGECEGTPTTPQMSEARWCQVAHVRTFTHGEGTPGRVEELIG